MSFRSAQDSATPVAVLGLLHPVALLAPPSATQPHHPAPSSTYTPPVLQVPTRTRSAQVPRRATLRRRLPSCPTPATYNPPRTLQNARGCALNVFPKDRVAVPSQTCACESLVGSHCPRALRRLAVYIRAPAPALSQCMQRMFVANSTISAARNDKERVLSPTFFSAPLHPIAAGIRGRRRFTTASIGSPPLSTRGYSTTTYLFSDTRARNACALAAPSHSPPAASSPWPASPSKYLSKLLNAST
ncbi:hypothetical protein FIBSPDRAFT_949319 [Athelia psychrophila]|uniref:Uncharacterized protein n=1 Tax=Athelia psychrophila TaxID=1759441 RepID=A0A166PTP7_9AGAM|nr:hypothetical protein FIBSPDRAFT_949319 [Fibularhizoctonia sp. CBS 109695]